MHVVVCGPGTVGAVLGLACPCVMFIAVGKIIVELETVNLCSHNGVEFVILYWWTRCGMEVFVADPRKFCRIIKRGRRLQCLFRAGKYTCTSAVDLPAL